MWANILLKVYKIPRRLYIVYCIQVRAPESRQYDRSAILRLEEQQKFKKNSRNLTVTGRTLGNKDHLLYKEEE